MTTEKVKALVDTTIKQSTFDASQITDPQQKFSLAVGEEIEINSYKPAVNNHWELALTSPVNEVTKWFAYKPHVTISDLANEYTKTIYPGLVLDAYKKLEHAVKTPVDRELSEEEGRKMFDVGILPILQSADAFMKATAEGQRELDLHSGRTDIKAAPCAYSVSCVMKYIAKKLELKEVQQVFEKTFETDCVQVTGVEKKLRRLGFLYFLKKDYLAPRGAIGARAPRWKYQGTKNGSGHIYFITKDGAKRTQFPNPGQENEPAEKGKDGSKWQIKDLHAENLHFFDHVYMQDRQGYTEGFWLPPGVYPFR